MYCKSSCCVYKILHGEQLILAHSLRGPKAKNPGVTNNIIAVGSSGLHAVKLSINLIYDYLFFFGRRNCLEFLIIVHSFGVLEIFVFYF